MAHTARIEDFPKWKQYRAIGNPPSKQRRLWRQEYRAALNQMLRVDPVNFQAFAQSKVTSIYDWY